MSYIPKMIIKLGLARPLYRLLKPLYKIRAMQFPTFNKTLHDMMLEFGDYFRYATIGLAVQRILTEDIPGCLAEVGVYRGDMSKFIHKIAPKRTLYLFDTFDGFPPQNLEDGETPDERFRDSSMSKFK